MLGEALCACAAPGAGLPGTEVAGMRQEALQALEAAVALAPRDPATLYSLALLQACLTIWENCTWRGNVTGQEGKNGVTCMS